jgi:hypothetical protein
MLATDAGQRLDLCGPALRRHPGAQPIRLVDDEDGVPWLVTESEVLRRHGAGVPIWKRYHAQAEGAPRLVAIGFHPTGVRVVDARGGGVVLRPAALAATRPIGG